MEGQSSLPSVPTETDAAGQMRDLERVWALLRSERFAECQTVCETILHRDPSHRRALFLLGATRARLNDLPGALPLFETLTQLDPAHGNGWLQRGLCLIGLPRFAEAAECPRQSTILQPDNAIAHYHHGGALAFLGRYAEALPILDRARILAPANPSIQALYATALKWTRGPDAAMRQFRILTETFPDFSPGWVGEALLHLALGEYEEGWKLQEWGLKGPNRGLRPETARLPRWSGQTVPRGASILVHSDAGLGDAIQFCRLIPLAAATGARLSLLVPRSLARLMRSLAGIDQVLVEGEPVPEFDFQCPLLSLPFALRITLDTTPGVAPYLHPTADLIAAWRGRLAAVSGLRVGLVWSAAARTAEPWAAAYGRRRSLPLDALAPLAAVSGIAFVSLQFGTGAEQTKHPPADMVLHDFGESIGDIEETGAVIANHDLVISVDTSTAHLAGAIGEPVWLMSAFDQDWRWILGRADSPWYPMHLIFRQATSGDRASVVHDVANAWLDYAAGRR